MGRFAVGLLCGLLALPPVPAAATAGFLSPPGYRVVATEPLAPGIVHQTLRQDDPPQDVHVARLAPGVARRLRGVLGGDVLGSGSGGEPTSSMCARVKCVTAVNGDFFDGAGRPVGAMVASGELVASPSIEHILFRVDGQGQPHLSRGIDWHVAVAPADGVALPVVTVNRPLAPEGIGLYSARWGPSTGTDATTVEVVLQLLQPTSAALPSGRSPVRVAAVHGGGNASIPAGHVVLSGRGVGGRALVDLAQRATGSAVLDVRVGDTTLAIGGSPQLLQDGALAYPSAKTDSFTRHRQPRTALGISRTGALLLVTADGRGTSSGLTLQEAAALLAALGAVHAMNLDGGGSTTFVTGGTVRNAPSDGAERRVVSALTVVPDEPPDPLTSLLAEVAGALGGVVPPATSTGAEFSGPGACT